MRSVSAVVVVVASVLLLVQAIWAEEEEVSSNAEFEVVIPTVTIDVKDTPVSQVLAELNRQAGVKLSAEEEIGCKRITLQVKDIPVLEALTAALAEAGADAAGLSVPGSGPALDHCRHHHPAGR